MKRILYNLFMQLVFWMVAFAIGRALYMIYYVRVIVEEKTGFWHAMAAFWHALHLDLATTCYVLLLPFILLLFQSLYSPAWLNILHKTYTFVILLIYTLIIGAEIGVYYEWRTKLPFKALLYLSNPGEIYKSSETDRFFIIIGLFLIQLAISFLLYLRYFFKPIVRVKRNYIFTFLFLVFTPPLLIIGARGGIQPIPIMQSQAYYSTHQFLNLASTNSFFNLSNSIRENYKSRGENPFSYFPLEYAEETVRELYMVPKDTTLGVLSTPRPNIVWLVLESWSADLISSLGGDPGITPSFDSLVGQGILFTNLYASGTRSEQGISCLFGGFPAHPLSSISVQPDKYNKLPSLPRMLSEQDYRTSFYFGGQLMYGNMKSYIYYNGFDRIREIEDFDASLPRGKLGIHDEFILAEQLLDLASEETPFLSVLFTLSTHSPFDMPLAEKKDWGYNALINDYLNSAYYTDQCLGDYFRKATEQSWYDSTLFIIVADHSHFSQRNWPYHTPEYHRIPLLFVGPVIREDCRGMKVDVIGSQVDIATTLLTQLKLDPRSFVWSKNLLNPYVPPFAYVAYDVGIGWIVPEGYFFWIHDLDTYYNNTLRADISRHITDGKSFLQVVYQRYLDY